MVKDCRRFVLVVPALVLMSSLSLAQAGEQPTVEQLKQLHAQLVHDIQNGTPLSTTAPADLRKPLANYVRGQQAPTYAQLLAIVEQQFAANDLPEVTVGVVSSPHQCMVKYKPVVGGTLLDLGETKQERKLKPKFYRFTCACSEGGSLLTQQVDCTEDVTVSFECGHE